MHKLQYEKYGYSFKVPADRDSLVNISKKLDNKSFQNTVVKNRFKNLINKKSKVGAKSYFKYSSRNRFRFSWRDEQDNLIKGRFYQRDHQDK